MMNCPKCGFTQPKDRYCASCGVDMLAFKPAEPTMGEKLKGSWLVQIGLLTLIGVGGFSYFHKETNQVAGKMLADFESATDLNAPAAPSPTASTPGAALTPTASQNDVASATDDSSEDTTPEPIDQQNVAAAPTSSPTTTVVNGASTAPSNPSESAPSDPNNNGRNLLRATEAALGETGSLARSDSAVTVQRIRVTFAEVPRPFVTELVHNTRSLASEGSFSGGVIADLTSRLKAESGGRGINALDTATEYPVRINQPIVLFKGTRDDVTEQNLGLTTQITPISLDEQGVQIQIEVSRVLRDGANPPAEQTYQESFLIPKEGGVYLTGLLPRRTLDAEESRLYANSPVLRVMMSQPFQQNSSDFLIFIEGR